MPDTTYTNNVGFAPEIAPYGQNLLGMAASQVYDYQMEDQKDKDGNPILGPDGKPLQIPVLDADGMPIISGLKAAPTYKGDRQAKYSDLQNTASAAAEGLDQNASSSTAATNLEDLASDAGTLSYDPSTFKNAYTAPINLNYAATDAKTASAGIAGLAQAQTANAAQLAAAPTATAAQGTAASTGTAPTVTASSMGPADKLSTSSFTAPGSADTYMSPYMQSVVAAQQREARRTADIASTRRNADAVKQGAFGGTRQAIMDAEAERNLATQQGDIQALGLQNAYTQAQAQFNAEQKDKLTAAQSNQQANLTVGAQNLTAAQQSALANQATASQYGLTNAQMAQQTGMANTANTQQAALANQATASQYGLTQGQLSQQAGLQTSAQAQQSALANAQAGNQMAQYNAGLGQQTNLANAAATNQAAQFGAGQELASAQTGAQYGQAANQLNEQSSQFGAGLGLQALQTGIQANTALGAQGQNLYNQDVNNISVQNQIGTQQQQNAQNILTQQYTDFQNQANAPYKQLGFMSDVVRGAPTSVQGTTISTPAPSVLNQVAGIGTALYGTTLKARGGAIKSRKPAGLAALLINSMA
jgi:hypothetical protein